jgi:hypothetical protein
MRFLKFGLCLMAIGVAACGSTGDDDSNGGLLGAGSGGAAPMAVPGGSGGMTSGSGGTAIITGSGGMGSTTMGGAGMMAIPGSGGASAPLTDSGMPGMDDGGSVPGKPYHDPGTGEWEVVPPSDTLSVCKLDPDKLKAAESMIAGPFLVVRYGKVCYERGATGFAPTEAWSTTKTLGALVTGMVSYETRMIMKSGPKTGQLTDLDRADQWLTAVPYNADAQVAHVLGMVAHDASLEWGQKSFAYDTVGTTEINSLSDMMNAAIAQDKTRLGANVEEFTQNFLFKKIGMTKSSWSTGAADKVLAYSWSTDLFDMARVGLLMLNNGMWGNERLVSEEWIYSMTHPSFEDANTGFGYLTWLNSSSNWTSISGGKQQMAATPGPCAPRAIHKTYPHGASQAMDCNYDPPATCDQKYDVGVFQAEGLGGQLIQVHRGLDLVIVARDAQPGGTGPGTAMDVWDPLKAAVIAADPMFKGDEAAFCDAYGKNNYAPDLH